MARVDDLATELLENIASLVWHKESLANGTLVCRTWRAPFQEYLFESINFNFEPGERLQRLHRANPNAHPSRERHLRSVRFLHVWNGRDGYYPSSTYDHTTIRLKYLPIFKSLCNLTSIRLSHAPFGWEKLTLKGTRAVVDLFRRPMLRELMVHATMPSAHFPLAILPLCPNIRSFGLSYAEIQHHGTFPRFDENLIKLIAAYKKNENTNAGEDQIDGPELVKHALGPVGTVSLQGLTLSASAIPLFLSFAKGKGNSVVFRGRLTLSFSERFNPTMDPPNSQGLPLEQSPIFEVFCSFGANVTELRLHLSRYHAVTRGVYPTREALQTLTNLKQLSLAVDIQDASRNDTSVVANTIQTWLIDFLNCLPAPRQLERVEIVYRILVFGLADLGVPDLAVLTTAWNELDQVLGRKDGSTELLRDYIIVLCLHKSGKESRNVWEQVDHGVEEENGRPIATLFQGIRRRCENFKAFVIADPDYRDYMEELTG